MTRTFARISLLAVSFIVPSTSLAYAQEEVAKLVVGDGPFEVVGNNGIFGFVIARNIAKTIVTFKPCYGPSFDIETNKLKRTSLKCEDGPSPNPHPLNVTCMDTSSVWMMKIPKIENNTSVYIGAVYEEKNKDVKPADKPSMQLIYDTFSKVSQFKACGDSTIGFGKAGNPVVRVLNVPQVNELKLNELYIENKQGG